MIDVIDEIQNWDLFIQNYWQKKPVLIKNFIKNWSPLINKEQLFELSFEEELNSRVISHHPDSTEQWIIEHGPFDEDTIVQLGTKDWTLLVNDVESVLPEFLELKSKFNFTPNWRLDDVMISYATTGGSVGAHTDQYDVFLLQNSGKRNWQLQLKDLDKLTHYENLELKIINNFKSNWECILEEGDMLYLPPNIPHFGTAMDDDCITISIGYRSPSLEELLAQYLESPCTPLHEQVAYNDAHLVARENRGEFNTSDIQNFENHLKQVVFKENELLITIGVLLSSHKRLAWEFDEGAKVDKDDWENLLSDAQNTLIYCQGRLLYFNDYNETILFFMNGLYRKLSMDYLEFINFISRDLIFNFADIIKYFENKELEEFFKSLCAQGVFEFVDK